MQTDLENFITMAITAATKCHTYQLVVDSSATFKANLLKVDNKISAIQVVQQVRAVSTKGLTADKKQKRKAAAVVTRAVGKAVANYAFDNSLTNLLKSAKIDNQKLLRGRDTVALDTFKFFHELGVTYKDEIIDYGVTDAMLTQFNSLISDYEAAIPAVRNHRVALKNATAKTKTLCKELDELLVNGLDAGMEQFFATEKDFYFEYFSARMVIGNKGPSTGIKGYVKDKFSKLKLKKAKVTLLEVNEQRYTSKTGFWSFKKLSPALYTVIIEMEGYSTLTLQNVEVKQGLLTALKIEMTKAEQENVAA